MLVNTVSTLKSDVSHGECSFGRGRNSLPPQIGAGTGVVGNAP